MTCVYIYRLASDKIEQPFCLDDYNDYRTAVDKVREASGIEISRNDFDHLLWYYHKGRL